MLTMKSTTYCQLLTPGELEFLTSSEQSTTNAMSSRHPATCVIARQAHSVHKKLSVNVTHRHNIIHVILSDHHKCAGLPWRLDFNPHTHPIPTEKPVGIPTVSPYLQNPEILRIHIPKPRVFSLDAFLHKHIYAAEFNVITRQAHSVYEQEALLPQTDRVMRCQSKYCQL